MFMLKLIHKPEDPPGFLINREYKKGVKELIISTQPLGTGVEKFEFCCTGDGKQVEQNHREKRRH